MSFSLIVKTILLGSSLVTAFVLQPSSHSVSHHRCHAESLQSIRKDLLRALNLQVEPWLPVGGLDAVREQWQSTLNIASHKAKDTEAFVDFSFLFLTKADSGNSTSLKCCSMASEIFMKDLGWDNWMIQPSRLTVVHCALCNPDVNPVQCPLSQTILCLLAILLQVPCCQPNSQEMVPVVYVNEFSTVVISSMQLTRSCGCTPGDIQQPSKE
uniref:TGF-beta family profile domain-containing protein n=1 Tax=Echeneis naucrates TaxID=173247 RepID=A0A665UF85_ECHNA